LIRTLTRHIYLNQRGFSIIFTPNNRANRGAWVSCSLKRLKNIFFLVIQVFVIAIFLSGCGSGQYTDKANEAIDSIHEILISEKLCSDKNDCSKKQFVFFESVNGVYISVYGVDDQSIKEKIVAAFIRNHARNPMIYYELNMYNLTKDEDFNSSKPKATILRLILNKGE
jgi:hypothetical protein